MLPPHDYRAFGTGVPIALKPTDSGAYQENDLRAIDLVGLAKRNVIQTPDSILDSICL